MSHAEAKARIDTALAAGWLRVDSEKLPNFVAARRAAFRRTGCDRLAVALRADLLLIDEKAGRTGARHMGLAVGGVLGELLHAKLVGWIPSLQPELHRLRIEAKFFIDSAIEKFILGEAGE